MTTAVSTLDDIIDSLAQRLAHHLAPILGDSTAASNVRAITASEKPVLSVDETAKLLGMSRSMAYSAVNSGDLPSVRIGRRILVPRHAIAVWIRGEHS